MNGFLPLLSAGRQRKRKSSNVFSRAAGQQPPQSSGQIDPFKRTRGDTARLIGGLLLGGNPENFRKAQSQREIKRFGNVYNSDPAQAIKYAQGAGEFGLAGEAQTLQDEQAARALKAQQAQDAAAQKAQIDALISQLPPEQQVAYFANPEKFGESLSTNLEAANVAAGNSRFVNGGFEIAPDAAFTLSQGQERFDADGNSIAGVAPKQERTFEQDLALKRAGASKTTVNTGDLGAGQRPIVDKPDKGFQRIFDDESGTYRDIPIPGSNSARTREDDNITAFRAQQSSNIQFDTMKNNIAEARNLIGPGTAGYGGLLSALPASSQRQLKNRLDTVRSNIGFDKLQEMRENSPTGGALGQVSEREIDFLQATRGKLDQLTRPEDLLQAMDEIEASLTRLQEVRQIAYEQEYGTQEPGQSRGQIVPTTNTPLPNGFEGIDPDDLEFMTPDERALFE